jgi:hypothetical protein
MIVSFGQGSTINVQDFNFIRVVYFLWLFTHMSQLPARQLLDFARLDFNRLGSLAGGLLLFLLLSVVRLNSREMTNKSTSIGDLSAGDRFDSLLISSLALLVEASPSIDSIFTQNIHALNDKAIIARVFSGVFFALYGSVRR